MRFLESPINREDFSWKQWSLVNDEEVISLSHAKVYVFSDSVLRLGKVTQNPTSNTVWEEKVELVQRFTTIQNFGHNWRRADGIRWEYFPRIHHIAACPWSPRVHDLNGRSITNQRTNYLHVDVQWHHMGIWRQWTGMHCWRRTCDFICKKDFQ